MKRLSKRVCVGLMGMIFMLALVSANPVEAKVPLHWDVNATYTFDPEWTGVIVREDGVSGSIILDIIESKFVADLEISKSIWLIEWEDGGYIEGTLEGMVSYRKLVYVFNGKITVTSDNWSHLNGRNVHVTGNIHPSFWTTWATFQIN